MNTPQAFIFKPIDIANISVNRKNGGSKKTSGQKGETESIKTQNHFLRFRLEEMQVRNARLENLIEQNEAKLAQVLEANKRFISVIGHDLRGPFCSILSVLEMLKDGLDEFGINDIARYVDIASNSANKTLSLLDNLLAWNTLQSIDKSFKPVRINIFELIDEEIEFQGIRAAQKKIVIYSSVNPGLEVFADIQMITSVVRNLISNALKFTNQGGEITVKVSEKKQYFELIVEDNGVGISAEDQQKLFIPEIRYSTQGTMREQGTGLGLIICKEFVEIHGGSISIDSQPGKGSRFIISIPQYS